MTLYLFMYGFIYLILIHLQQLLSLMQLAHRDSEVLWHCNWLLHSYCTLYLLWSSTTTFRTRLTAFGPISAYIRVVLSVALEFCEILAKHKIIMNFKLKLQWHLNTTYLSMVPTNKKNLSIWHKDTSYINYNYLDTFESWKYYWHPCSY